ncbi:MAG: DUF4838 domain-containing protein [Phycisphaerae bacterium]|nr:DUF4838 domain-containing protein [Phycisphaerae bacterium]
MMKYLNVVLSLIVPAFCTPAFAQTKSKLELSVMKQASIVLPSDAIESEKYAAEEFQSLWEKITGVKLPITTTPSSTPRVWIGPNPAAKSVGLAVQTDDLGEEGLRIKITEKGVAVAGGRPRGTLYGVYEFFEKYFGVRFLTHDHTHIPADAGKRILPREEFSFKPEFETRFSRLGETQNHKPFAVRMRCNRVAGEAKYGGVNQNGRNSHSFFRQIPSSKYGKEHPEYYCMIDGKRKWDVDGKDAMPILGNQPCLTNPDVLRIVTDSVLADLKRNPNTPNISVSTNDNFHYCQCPTCAALDEKEGAHTATLLAFVNAVADEVGKQYPDVKIGTLIYQYTRKPPKTLLPRPNVQLQLCTIECSQVLPLTDPDVEINASFREDLKEWGKRSKDIRIWTYNTNFYNFLLPCPNLWNIEPNLRLFADNNVRGVFMQAGHIEGTSMSDLRNYVTSRLLWNPRLSGQALIDEFLDLHYGPAAPPIRRFIHLVHDNAVKKGCTKNCFATGADYGIDDEITIAGLEAFAEAMELTGKDETLRRRVEKASICAWRCAVEDAWQWIYDVPNEKPNTHDKPMPAEIILKTRPYARKLFELCDRYGVTMWDELIPIGKAKDYFRQAYRLKDKEPI